eukprot:495622_1
MGCVQSIQSTKDYKNITICNGSKHKKILVRVQVKKTTITTTDYQIFCNIVAKENKINYNCVDQNKSISSIGLIDVDNDNETKQLITKFIDDSWKIISPERTKTFHVQQKMVYISAVDITGNKIVYNFGTLGTFFVFDGESLNEEDKFSFKSITVDDKTNNKLTRTQKTKQPTASATHKQCKNDTMYSKFEIKQIVSGYIHWIEKESKLSRHVTDEIKHIVLQFYSLRIESVAWK